MATRIRIMLVVLVLVVTGCGGGPLDGRGSAGLDAATLEVHVLNVGQGHALFARGPDGTTLLVDGGGFSATSKLVAYLTRLGLPPGSALDYVVLTHRDADHYPGITGLLESGYDVRRAIWDNGSSKSSTTITRFVDATASTTAGPVRGIPLGTVIALGAGATATCVAVHGEVLGHGPVAGATDENDLSVALLLQFGDFDFIVAGDLGGGDDDSSCTGRVHSSANVETPLARALTGGPSPLLGPEGVEAMLVNHHGSHSSSNSDYVNLLNPRVAIIGVGANTYEHPRRVVVENTLSATVPCVTAPAALVLQTDEGDTRATADDVTFAGFVVGDVVLKTTGSRTFEVLATGDAAGPDERVAAGLPASFRLDEVPACQSDAECDDGNPCTVDRCQAGACSRVPGNAGAVCRASVDACDAAEVCDGQSPACPADAVAPDGTSCSDGNACNGNEVCRAGACAAGAPPSCDDGNPCTTDACDPQRGCVQEPLADGTSCSDGNACNGDEVCRTGACAAGAPPSCDDGNPCTTDACDPQRGCVNVLVSPRCEPASCSADPDACADPMVHVGEDPRPDPPTATPARPLDSLPNGGRSVPSGEPAGEPTVTQKAR